MSKTITELLNGGLVTSRIGSLLGPGELQRADDTVYQENDPAIWRAPGRTQYGTVVASQGVLGLAHLPFENRTPKMLAYSGSTLYHLPVNFASSTNASTEIGTSGFLPGTVAIVSTHSEFTATTGTPFLAAALGAQVRSFEGVDVGDNIVVAEVKAAGATVVLKHLDGTTVSSIFIAGSYEISFEWGIKDSFSQNTTLRQEMLDVVQYGASYFAWTGSETPRRIEWQNQPQGAYGTGQTEFIRMRKVGLNPVIVTPTIDTLTGTIPDSGGASYAWVPSLKTGYFWFLITEIYAPRNIDSNGTIKSDAAEEIESAYLAKDALGRPGVPLPKLISTPNMGIRITLPAPVNNGNGGRISTDWGIYMSEESKEDTSTPPSLATFKRVKQVKIDRLVVGQVVDLYENLASEISFVTAVAAADGGTTWFQDSQMIGSPNDLTNSGDNTARAAVAAGTGSGGQGSPNAITELTFANLNPGGTRDAFKITGFSLQIFCRGSSAQDATQGSPKQFYWYLRTAAKKSIVSDVSVNHGSYAENSPTMGGPGQNFGATWGNGSTLGSFRMVVGFIPHAYSRVWIDAVGMQIFYATETINLKGKSYRVVVYRDQIGTSVAEPAAYPPPNAVSTGDFFQGMLVLNDLNDVTALRYSLPGQPEYFPKPYVLRLNSSKKNDKITFIRSLGRLLIVGLENSIERINYLPRETNTDLTDALSHEELSSDHGIPGPLAACKFDMPGQGTILAYASSAGMFITNGIWTRPLSLDLDWPNTVKLSALSSCVMRVHPRKKWLVLDYCPFDAVHDMNTRRLVFSYGMDKIKEGGFLPVTGPIVVSGRSSCEIFADGTSRLMTGHETTGVLYNEDVGTTIPVGYQVRLTDNTNIGDGKATASVDVKILPLIRTRKMYPAGIERDAREERVYLHFSPYGSANVSKVADTVQGSATVATSGGSGTMVVGMRVVGTGIDPGTIVTVVASQSSITLSRAANATLTGVTLTFDTGTIAISVRASGIGEAVTLLETSYASTLTGDLLVVHPDNVRQGLELQFEKVVLPGGTTFADLGVNMRLHQFSILLNDQGLESNRSVA